MNKFIDKLDDVHRTLNWLIDGMGIHGLKLSDLSIIDWNWVCINYNLENKNDNIVHS
jgi:hypothetical protein